MSARHAHPVHPRGILSRLIDRIRGREQLLVRAGDDRPLLLLTYPRGAEEVAHDIEAAWARTLRRLSPATVNPYEELLSHLPAMVVVALHPLNPCQCLGHHHPRGAESRLTRRLAADLGEPVSELDLAYEGIRNWSPEPLSSLAAGELGERLPALHFHAAVLGVLLHELEHLVWPERSEQEVRKRSNAFYSAAMRDLVSDESGAAYGMASPRPPRP